MRTNKILTPLRAIREKCMDCCCENPNYVMACPCTDCTLWSYRFGKRPVTIKETKPLLMDVRFFDENIDLEQIQMVRKLKGRGYV